MLSWLQNANELRSVISPTSNILGLHPSSISENNPSKSWNLAKKVKIMVEVMPLIFFSNSYELVLSNMLIYKTKDFIKVILRDITGVSKFGA